MAMGIEEKLSTIKAINHEIDECDRALEEIEKFRISGIDCISFHKGIHAYDFNPIPKNSAGPVFEILDIGYRTRKKQLIDQAQKLMK